jgi:hypothetical protein
MLTSKGFNVVSDEEAILILSQSPGRFVLYIGAGASVEVGVPTAAGICNELADELVRIEEKQRQIKGITPLRLTANARKQFLKDRLDWDNEEDRYYNCVTRVLRAPAARVDYFRKKLEHVKPAFAHYASSSSLGSSYRITLGMSGGAKRRPLHAVVTPLLIQAMRRCARAKRIHRQHIKKSPRPSYAQETAILSNHSESALRPPFLSFSPFVRRFEPGPNTTICHRTILAATRR